MEMQHYKPSKTVEEQVEYLNQNKRVQFNEIDRENARDILLYNNYINVITPFKHHFAKKDKKQEVIKDEYNQHIYERDVEFSEYYEKFKEERSKYPIIAKNIIAYESHFKAILAYRILTNNKIETSDDLINFLENIRLCAFYKNNFPEKRNSHINDSIENLEKSVENYADVYCFFDRLSLGASLNIFLGLPDETQNMIFSDLKKIEMNFNVMKISDFIPKVFTLVSIRNCVMHCNSLEILIRFYNPKTHQLRKNNNRKRFINMINDLSIEKSYAKI